MSMSPLIIIAATLGGIVLFRHLIKSTDKHTRQHEEEWALRQFSRILAKHTEKPEKDLFEQLRNGGEIIFPSDFKEAVLQYKLNSSTNEGDNVLKKLVVSFSDTEMSVETKVEWINLPAEIRNELLQTGQMVQRNFS